MNQHLIETWRSIIVGDGKSWVLFANGTCVILMEPEEDLRAQAVALLREFGPVHPGTASADFGTINLEHDPGWVVTCHHPDILTYFGVEEGIPQPSESVVGMLGRMQRHDDSTELDVIHVEDNRRRTQ